MKRNGHLKQLLFDEVPQLGIAIFFKHFKSKININQCKLLIMVFLPIEVVVQINQAVRPFL